TLGSPMPTKQVMPSRSARAAQAVIISSEVNALPSVTTVSDALMPRPALAQPGPCRAGLGAWLPREDVGLQPPPEALPLPADGIPGDVEVVVALGVAERVGGVRPARHLRDAVDRPAWQHDRARPRAQLGHDLLDGDHRPPCAEHRFLLDPGN